MERKEDKTNDQLESKVKAEVLQRRLVATAAAAATRRSELCLRAAPHSTESTKTGAKIRIITHTFTSHFRSRFSSSPWLGSGLTLLTRGGKTSSPGSPDDGAAAERASRSRRVALRMGMD